MCRVARQWVLFSRLWRLAMCSQCWQNTGRCERGGVRYRRDVSCASFPTLKTALRMEHKISADVLLPRRDALPTCTVMIALCRSVGRLIACALLAGACIGCSSPVPAPDNAQLENRVKAWWSARQAGDVAQMYEMFEPSFRAGTKLSEFGVHATRMRHIPIENPRIVSISRTPDPNRAVVSLVGQTMLPRTGALVDIDINDQWVLQDGQWWRVYVPPRLPFE